jgi:FAD/FMN-containing dehydrogenase
MYELVEVTREKVAIEINYPVERGTGYGHLGDGNLHLNVWQPSQIESNQINFILSVIASPLAPVYRPGRPPSKL